MAKKKKKILVIGGGTGTYTILSGLKKFKELDLSVIVSMMDSGGSNRVIRDEFGLLPTSDIRQCMVALASDESHELLRKLFTYRYNQGTGISGMSFGNLFMAALTDIYGSQEEAIRKTSETLDVMGTIAPVTYDDAHLVARYDNGKQVLGEHFIDEPKEDMNDAKIVDLELVPNAKANKKALWLIKEADVIIFGPGDLYTSIICNLIVDGVTVAIKKSKAKKIFVMNLMTKTGQTTGFKASDHLKELEKYLEGSVIDIVLINKRKVYPNNILKRYKEEGAKPVEDDLNGSEVKVIRRSFISSTIYKKQKGDRLKRSLIRHDAVKLANAIAYLL